MSLMSRILADSKRRKQVRRKNLFDIPGGGMGFDETNRRRAGENDNETPAPRRKGSKPKRTKGGSKMGGRKGVASNLNDKFATATKKPSRKKKPSKIGEVLFNMHADLGKPEAWPGMEDEGSSKTKKKKGGRKGKSKQPQECSNLESLFDTYWNGTAATEQQPAPKFGSMPVSPLKKRKTGHKSFLASPVRKVSSPREFLSKSPVGSKRARAMLTNTLKLEKKRPQLSAKDRLLAKTPTRNRRKNLLHSPLQSVKRSPRNVSPAGLKTPRLSPAMRNLSKMTLLSPSLSPADGTKSKKVPRNDTLIPLKLKTLFVKFKAMESTFRIAQGRDKFGCTFDELKQGVERICKRSFTQEDLAKLFRLVPDLLHAKWTHEFKKDGTKKASAFLLMVYPKNHLAKDKDAELYSHFLKGTNCTVRLELLTDRLTAYTRAKHKKFCKDSGEEPPVGRFHAKFELDEVDVKPAALPKCPKRTTLSAREALLTYGKGTRVASKPVQERLSKLSAAERVGLSDIVKNSLAKYEHGKKKKRAEQKQADDVLDMSKIPENLRHLPRSTLLKLQGRSKAKDILKVDKKAQDAKLIIETLPEVVRYLKAYMRSAKRSAIPFLVLTARLRPNIKGKPSTKRMERMLEELCRIVPEFAEIETSKVKIFRIKNCKASLIYQKLKAAAKEIKL